MARPWPRIIFLSLLPKKAVLICHYYHSGQTHDNLCHSIDIRTVQAHMVALRHAIKSASHVCGLQRIGGPNTPWQQTCLYIGRPLSSHFAFFFTLSTIVNLNILYLHATAPVVIHLDRFSIMCMFNKYYLAPHQG